MGVKSAILANHQETTWNQQKIVLSSPEEIVAHSVTFTAW